MALPVCPCALIHGSCFPFSFQGCQKEILGNTAKIIETEKHPASRHKLQGFIKSYWYRRFAEIASASELTNRVFVHLPSRVLHHCLHPPQRLFGPSLASLVLSWLVSFNGSIKQAKTLVWGLVWCHLKYSAVLLFCVDWCLARPVIPDIVCSLIKTILANCSRVRLKATTRWGGVGLWGHNDGHLHAGESTNGQLDPDFLLNTALFFNFPVLHLYLLTIFFIYLVVFSTGREVAWGEARGVRLS